MLLNRRSLPPLTPSVKRCLPLHRISARTPSRAFLETRTAARVAELLRGCGLSPANRLARTGVKAVLQGGAPGPCAAVIGELDGILCPAHPAANPENGVAHACGHNAQLTALVGAALR